MSLPRKAGRPMPWRMCRTCHRVGTSKHGACPRTSHPVEGTGACGQCGKRRPLLTCHGYNFTTRGINRTTKKRKGVKAKPRKPLAKVGKQKAKRQASNAEYYKSAEWKAKKKAVHERDGYQCTEWAGELKMTGHPAVTLRCPNRGEIVNGKQTARGLVAEETGYMHRGIPDSIDRIKTRCKDCDRRLTPLERVNHSQGFNNSRRSA